MNCLATLDPSLVFLERLLVLENGHIAVFRKSMQIRACPCAPEPASLASDLHEVPLVGRVAAGEPILATENIETTLQVDRSLLPASGTIFALRVHGESMKNAGILDGDIVLARQQENAERGDIVVAQIGGDATVKHYAPEDGCIRLLPANEAFQPIVVPSDTADFSIAGKVVGLMRRF